MRKLSFSLFSIFTLLTVCLAGEAMAACQLFSCGGRDSVNASADGYGTQCYYCNDNYAGDKQCKDGDIVGQVDPQGRITNLVQCQVTIWNDYWNAFNPSVFCPNSDIRYGNPDATFPNSYKSYSLDNGNKTIGYVSGDDTVLKAGNTACVYVKCNDGYMPNADKSACIEDNRESRCTSTGGTWNGSACTCSPSKNLKLTSDGAACECVSSDYEFDSVAKQCNKKKSVIDEENRRRQQEEQNRQNQQRKAACEQSGGVWANNQCSCDNAKNLRLENNVCVCLDDVNYVRNGDRCDLTDAAALQQKCTSADSVASGAYWDDVNKQCRCTNQQYAWNGSVCAMNPAIQKCLLITGANWDYSRNQCYCMEVGKTLNADGTACIDATVSSSGDAGVGAAETTITQQQNAARERIEGAVSKLDEIASGLKLTVWRNEEGKFNTSRLLSDSIAGVVLGTAGGLITSHVVKKNNIENGFEDIQCTVGGQVVAGWGDQFRVGIQ